MKKVQNIEDARENYILVKRDVELFYILTHIGNLFGNKKDNIISFFNNVKKADYVDLLKKQYGITLISLIVTIIVLLILAGVSINIALANNGIFEKAQSARDTMESEELKERIETLIVNWKADKIVDNNKAVEEFWKDLENAGIIEDVNEIGAPDDADTENGVKKDTYIIETTDAYNVEIIITEDQNREINISIGNIEKSSSTEPRIKIEEIKSTETSLIVKTTVKRLNDGKITYFYRERGEKEWIEVKKDTTDLTVEITNLTKGKTYEVKACVENSIGTSEIIKEKQIEISVTSITLNPTSRKLKQGETVNIEVDVLPENATNKKCEWTSSDTSVATVDKNGLVTAVAEKGNAIITATVKDNSEIKAECNITVTLNPAEYIWTQNKTEVIGTHKTISEKTVKYEVGEEYDYTIIGASEGHEYTGTWAILGAGEKGSSEEGRLLIMTTSFASSGQGFYGKDDYNTAISRLNAICETTCGIGARCVNADDVNRVTGYNPEETGDGKAYNEGKWTEYGNIITFRADKTTSTKITTPYTDGLYYGVFYHPDGRQIGKAGGEQVDEIIIKNTGYQYYNYSMTDSSSRNEEYKGLPKESKAYKLIFRVESIPGIWVPYSDYWLATTGIEAGYRAANYGIFYVNASDNNEFVVNGTIFNSYPTTWNGSPTHAIRAVVVQ